jgi:hypothetical protein
MARMRFAHEMIDFQADDNTGKQLETIFAETHRICSARNSEENKRQT